ncbi:MAG: serine hydrolase [Streptosporangiaceae bacterium]|jgi:D-alanyl-D-alanine carboxypeptidase (penicillin-binding protein 5/6)
MRLRVRIASLTVVAVSIGAASACGSSAAAQSPRPAPARTSAPAARAAASASPSLHRSSASPAIEVTGAPRGVKAKGAVLADAVTGQVLWARAAGTERPMASVTKVMTALLVLESGDLGQEIQVPKAAFSYAWKYGGESAALHPGDVLTVGELLEALLLPSGADAAYTLANAYGPGLNAFVTRMNATAARMGMTQTHFTSPDGLPYPTETSTYSTPSDLLTLGLAAMRYPVFRSIVDQRFYQLRKGPGHHAYWWDNTNDLIGSYQGALGIKTGYTDDAGHCLLFEATRNDRMLIGAVLDSPATGPAAGSQDAVRMLNWGFGLRRAG